MICGGAALYPTVPTSNRPTGDTGRGAAVTPVRQSAWQAWQEFPRTRLRGRQVPKGPKWTTMFQACNSCLERLSARGIEDQHGTTQAILIPHILCVGFLFLHNLTFCIHGRRLLLTPRYFCVAGVALGDIHLDFTWQAWHKLTSTVVLRGRRGTDTFTYNYFVAHTNLHVVSFCVAGVAQNLIYRRFAWYTITSVTRHFAWQAWHKLTHTFVTYHLSHHTHTPLSHTISHITTLSHPISHIP